MPRFDSTFCAPEARRGILFAAILGSSMGFIDGSVVAIAIPAIRAGLGASLVEAQWINNAYMVALAALVLAGGAVGDRFGTARLFSAGIALFVLMSLACAVAPTAHTLIWARWAQGAGAALMIPGSLAIIARAYPREVRARAIGYWAAASAVTTALGPIIGGLVLTFGGEDVWRVIFAVNLPLGIAALWLVRRNVALDRPRPDRGVDLPGAALATLGLGLVAWGFIRMEAGHGVGWRLALGFASLAAFLWVEHRSPNPMVPLQLFRERVFSLANLVTFTLYFGLSAVVFFLPMLIITGWDMTPIRAVIALGPMAVAIAALSRPFGKLSDRIGLAPLIGGGALVVGLGYGWLALAVEVGGYWTGVILPLCLAAIGMAMVVAPLSAAIMASAGDDAGGTASGINNAVSRVAGLMAVAVMGPVVASTYRAAGGTLGYGDPRAADGHAEAMTAAFSGVAWGCSWLALVSGVIALVGLWRR